MGNESGFWKPLLEEHKGQKVNIYFKNEYASHAVTQADPNTGAMRNLQLPVQGIVETEAFPEIWQIRVDEPDGSTSRSFVPENAIAYVGVISKVSVPTS